MFLENILCERRVFWSGILFLADLIFIDLPMLFTFSQIFPAYKFSSATKRVVLTQLRIVIMNQCLLKILDSSSL